MKRGYGRCTRCGCYCHMVTKWKSQLKHTEMDTEK
jgi:hypothetical protein